MKQPESKSQGTEGMTLMQVAQGILDELKAQKIVKSHIVITAYQQCGDISSWRVHLSDDTFFDIDIGPPNKQH